MDTRKASALVSAIITNEKIMDTVVSINENALDRAYNNLVIRRDAESIEDFLRLYKNAAKKVLWINMMVHNETGEYILSKNWNPKRVPLAECVNALKPSELNEIAEEFCSLKFRIISDVEVDAYVAM